jgi:hypothetical protein
MMSFVMAPNYYKHLDDSAVGVPGGGGLPLSSMNRPIQAQKGVASKQEMISGQNSNVDSNGNPATPLDKMVAVGNLALKRPSNYVKGSV